MTGEMCREKLTPESYPTHFAIAAALGGTVEPFDQYQGPYVLIGADIRIGCEPYAYAPTHLGVVRLWLQSDDGALCTVYNEATNKLSPEFFWDDTDGAIEAARETL